MKEWVIFINWGTEGWKEHAQYDTREEMYRDFINAVKMGAGAQVEMLRHIQPVIAGRVGKPLND